MKRSLLLLTKTVANSLKPSALKTPIFTSVFTKPQYFFSADNKVPTSNSPQIPKQNIQIRHQQAIVGQQQVDTYKTAGAISILDHIKGTKQTDSGQLYALMFTCKKCNTKSIRSFTKNAYHKGVVLIRCQGCQNVHLVADNLGWFNHQPLNLENMGDGQVQKVHDPVAITRFIKAAFGDQPPVKKQGSKNVGQNQKVKNGQNIKLQNNSSNEQKNKKE